MYMYYGIKYDFYRKYIQRISKLLHKSFVEINKEAEKKRKPNAELTHIILDGLHSIVTEISEEKFNKYFNNSCLIFFYSAFEGDLKNICNRIQTFKKHRAGINDIAGQNYIEKSKTYLTKIVGMNLDKFNKEWEIISNYQKVRNQIAHNNSMIELEDEKPQLKRSKAYRLIDENPHFSLDKTTGDFHIKDINYLKEFCNAAEKYISAIIEQIEKLPVEKE
jgi:hypothetical protein